jgi:hypothetical protein
MAKFPNYKQSKKMQKYESDILRSKMRIKNHKFEKQEEEKTLQDTEKEYKEYLIENDLNGFSLFQDVV